VELLVDRASGVVGVVFRASVADPVIAIPSETLLVMAT